MSCYILTCFNVILKHLILLFYAVYEKQLIQAVIEASELIILYRSGF